MEMRLLKRTLVIAPKLQTSQFWTHFKAVLVREANVRTMGWSIAKRTCESSSAAEEDAAGRADG